MKVISISFIALITLILAPGVDSFSLVPKITQLRLNSPQHGSVLGNRSSSANARLYYRSPCDAVDTSPTSVLTQPTIKKPLTKQSKSQESVKKVVVSSVASIQDYQEHVMNENEKVTILRVSAPWCRVCKATSQNYESLAKKICLSHSSQVKFLSVNIDGKPGTNELKKILNVKAVPMALVYHPNLGIVGQVKLGRANLGELKNRLNNFLEAGAKEADVCSILEGLA